MTRAVIFDWGAVLMRTVDIRSRMAWERRLGLAPGDLADLFFRGATWQDAQRGRATTDDAWAEVARHLGLDEEGTAILRQDFWAGDRLDEDLVTLIRELRAGGLRVALLSNFAAELPALLTDMGLSDLFDIVVVSGLEGVIKPNAAIYQRTLERLGVAAEEAIFIDDQQANVKAARDLGITSVRFRGTLHLRRALAATGLPVEVPPLRSLPSIRAVIFDWGGVFSPLTFRQHTQEWEKRLGLAGGELERILWGREWKRLEVGAITPQEFDEHVAHSLGLPDRPAVQSFYRAYYADEHIEWKVAHAARTLRDRYQVAMLTNAFPGHAELSTERHGFDPRAEFDLYVNSAEVRLAKPDPAVYQLVLDRLDVSPGEVVFLDDMVRNTDAAQALGMHTIVFASVDTNLRDLETLLGVTVLPD